jgi:hypothetical protein
MTNQRSQAAVTSCGHKLRAAPGRPIRRKLRPRDNTVRRHQALAHSSVVFRGTREVCVVASKLHP